MPRASIVVRSMDRPELAAALNSLAVQTATDVEVVVVAACGARHPAPPSRCGPHPVRFVRGEAPRSRPVAANAGLAEAAGDYVGLLDDDDLLLPAHIATLVAALEAAPASPAAYAIAREVGAAGEVLRVRDQAYSQLLLFEDCYIAPCSLLFRRSALARCRFDEALDIFEDWDFWLQLAELGDFTFVPRETSVFRAALGTSGTAAAADRDDPRYRHFRAQLAAKWGRRGREVAAAVAAAAARALELFAQGRREEAEAAANGVLARYPHEIGALNLKGTLLAIRGDLAGALARFAAAVAEMPTSVESRFNLAQAFERAGRTAEAAAEYDRILALAPGHAQAAARRAMLQVRREKTP